MCACLNIDHSLITCSIDVNIVNIHQTVGMYFLILTGNSDDIEWHDLQRSYHPVHDTLPAPLGVYWALGTVGYVIKPGYFLIHSRDDEYQAHILAWKRLIMLQQHIGCTNQTNISKI